MRGISVLMFVVLAIVLAGCARHATLVDFESGETLQAVFTDGMGTGGEIAVTMPDGEVLKGRYSAVRGGESFTFTSATASGSAGAQTASASGFGQSYSVGGSGRAYGLLTSTRVGSSLVMEVLATYGVLDGHGFGEARTNDGRLYKLQF